VRRARIAALVLVATGVAGGSVAVAVQQRQVADAWRDRATAVASQRDDALGRAEALAAQLDELGELARLTDSDLSDLEGRLTELAEEKARAEDRAVVTRVELETLARTTADASRQLDRCVTDLLALQSDTIAEFNRLGAGERVDVDPLNARLTEVREVCAAARQAGANAAALAASLR
jgi:chromosome segregation ATPase